MPITRNDVTEKIIAAKANHRLEWRDIALQIGANQGKTVAGCLGQAAFPPPQAEMLAKIFDLTPEEEKLLTLPPDSFSSDDIEQDPLLLSLHQIIDRYGMAIKEMIHDRLGDGTLKIHDLNIDMHLDAEALSQRVRIILDTKFLPQNP